MWAHVVAGICLFLQSRKNYFPDWAQTWPTVILQLWSHYMYICIAKFQAVHQFQTFPKISPVQTLRWGVCNYGKNDWLWSFTLWDVSTKPKSLVCPDPVCDQSGRNWHHSFQLWLWVDGWYKPVKCAQCAERVRSDVERRRAKDKWQLPICFVLINTRQIKNRI